MQDFKPDGWSLSSNLGTHMWLQHTRLKIEECEEEEEGLPILIFSCLPHPP